MAEKKLTDPSFELSRDILEMLAQRLTENGRELEGAVNRLHQTWQHVRGTLTPDIAETVIRDLIHSGGDQRRIKIEDILRVVSRHFGVSKGDLLSQRRHRSVVWPRQIGMWLAKQLTARSLPEIGRRFGNRDHTTVLHAIRKIEGELNGNQRLRDELEDLKKMLAVRNYYMLIIAFRYKKLYSTKRIFISFIYNTVLRVVFKSPFRDISTGIRLIHRAVVDDLELTSNSPFIGAELTLKSMLRGFPVGEVGIQTFPRDFGQGSATSFKNIMGTIRDIWRIRKEIFSDTYDLPEGRTRG